MTVSRFVNCYELLTLAAFNTSWSSSGTGAGGLGAYLKARPGDCDPIPPSMLRKYISYARKYCEPKYLFICLFVCAVCTKRAQSAPGDSFLFLFCFCFLCYFVFFLCFLN
jgi:hypothetical protein